MSGQPLPERGDHVQRIDTGEIGTVELVAVAGMVIAQPPCAPIIEGDIRVWMAPWRQIVTSGCIFWEKWRPVDLAALAETAIREGLRVGA